jgi:hypothetical protein
MCAVSHQWVFQIFNYAYEWPDSEESSKVADSLPQEVEPSSFL